jgi:protein-disulfide isomerase
VKPELVRQYVETGKAVMVWHDFPWFGEESRTAAQAARCAGEQSRFWEYHAHLYERQRGANRGAFSPDNLRAFASELPLDASAFGACLEQGADLPEIQREFAAARTAGITATPTFEINGQRVAGALPVSRFAELIEAELARRGR